MYGLGFLFYKFCLANVRSLRLKNWLPLESTNIYQRTDSPKSLLACKVLMECCVSSMQFYTIHAKKIDDIPMLPILYDKMELY